MRIKLVMKNDLKILRHYYRHYRHTFWSNASCKPLHDVSYYTLNVSVFVNVCCMTLQSMHEYTQNMLYLLHVSCN